MQSKTILALSLFSVAQVAYATPPPCLLAAINSHPNPADFKSICGEHATFVQRYIQSVCHGDDTTAALSSFADTCNTNGVKVPNVSTSLTSAPSSSSNSSSDTSSGTDTPTSATSGASSVNSTETATSGTEKATSDTELAKSGTSNGSAMANATGSHGIMSTGSGSMNTSLAMETGNATDSLGTSSTSGTSGTSSTSSTSATKSTSGKAAGSAKSSNSTTSGVAGQLAGSIGGLAMVAAGTVFML